MDVDLHVAEPRQMPALAVEGRRMVAEVYRALDRCSPKERVAWVLRYVQG